MSVRLDLTQSIRVLFHYRRSPHSTFFSRGRTLGPAVFNAPYSRNRARPSKKGLSVNHSFFLLRTFMFENYYKLLVILTILGTSPA